MPPRSLLPLLVALALAACARVSPRLDEARAAEPISGFVHVRADAPLWTRAEAAAAAPPRAHAPGPPRTSPMRVVADRGRAIEVETLGSAHAHHCADPSNDPFEALRIRLFVARTELAPVLARPAADRHADGTLVRLLPGVPGALGPGTFDVATEAFTASVRLGSDAIGFSYEPGERLETALEADPETPSRQGTRAPERLVVVDEKDLLVGGRPVFTKGWVPCDAGVVRRRLEPREGRERLALWTACTELVVSAPPEAVSWRPPPSCGRAVATLAASVPAGTRASWPDGRDAGVAGEEWTIVPKLRRETVGERTCFPLGARVDGARGRICFPTASIRPP